MKYGEHVSHPFGDLLSQHLHRKHGLSQAQLAEGILQAPTIVTAMCKGRRLTGPQARERVLAIIAWLRAQDTLSSMDEANALLSAAGMPPLHLQVQDEAALGRTLNVTAPVSPRLRRTLPAQITSFIGRDGEISALAKLLRAARLVTLTGAGGIGKTRLAIEVASRLREDFVDGLWFVNLAPVSDPTLVLATIAAALDLIEQPGRDLADGLHRFLAERHALLILDNCEHLIDACSDAISGLLSRCARLHVMATSRETLRVPGEIVRRVAPLTLPGDNLHSPAEMQAVDSVALFVDRARAAQPALVVDSKSAGAIMRICRRLDGIPLAIELAAAQLQSMTVFDVEQRLSDQRAAAGHSLRAQPPRHQTMRTALDWSFQSLSVAEQRLLMRLSVFSNGWMREQAKTVCKEPLALIDMLVQKSIVIADVTGEHTRYRLLEPIRQYAAEILESSTETSEVRRQHMLACLQLAQSAEPNLHSPRQQQWLNRLERENDNFHAALQWGLAEGGEPELGLQLVVALWQFWWMRAHIAEGRHWLELSLRLAAPATSPRLRAWALLAAGMLGKEQFGGIYSFSDIPAIGHTLKEALVLFRAAGENAGIALTLCVMGVIAGSPWDPARDSSRAQSLIRESHAFACRQDRHPWIAVYASYCLALMIMWQGDHPRAIVALTECLAAARKIGDAQIIAISLTYLANANASMLDFDLAIALGREAVRVAHETGDVAKEALTLSHLADKFRLTREFEQAGMFAEKSYALATAYDLRSHAGWGLTLFGLIARDRGELSQAAGYFCHSIAWHRDSLGVWGLWWNVLGLGTIATMQGKRHRAARLYGALEPWQRSINLLRNPCDQLQFGTYIESTRAELGDALYGAVFETGQAMNTEQAFLFALSDES